MKHGKACFLLTWSKFWPSTNQPGRQKVTNIYGPNVSEQDTENNKSLNQNINKIKQETNWTQCLMITYKKSKQILNTA